MKTRSSKAARLEDVARLAKVSTATVSRALTLPHKVKARTLERVQQAASTLGYVAHGAARALASRRTHTIGAVVPTLDNAIFANTIQALQRTLDAAGYVLLLASHEFDADIEARVTRTLIEQCQDESIPVVRLARPAEWVTDPNRIDEIEEWCRDVLKPVIDSLDMTQRSVYGQDFGRDGDLSVIWILQSYGMRRWRTGFVLELRKIPFDVQRHIMHYIIDNLPLFHHAKFDARGNGQSHAEAALQKYGEQRVDCVMATPKWYGEFFPKYKSAYEDRTIHVPKSEDVIADHRRVVLHQGSPKMSDGRDRGSDGMYRHGDSAIAGLMAYAAALEEAEPPAGSNAESPKDFGLPGRMQNRQRATMFR